MAKKSLTKRLTKSAPKEPAPISMKKPRAKKVAAKPVAAFNKDAPEHAEPKTVTKVVKDKALEARVAALESVGSKEIVVTMPVRPRITSVQIKYDGLGHPKELIPAYSE